MTTASPSEHSQSNEVDKQEWQPFAVLSGHSKPVTSVRFSNCGLWLASASGDRVIRLYDPYTATLVRRINCPAGINEVAFSPCNRYIAAVCDDAHVCVYDVQSGKLLRDFKGHTSHVLCLAWNLHGNILATGSFDESVRIWDTAGNKSQRVLQASSDAVTSVDFSIDGTITISAALDGNLRLWDTASGLCLRTLQAEGVNHPISFAAFTPNSQHLIVSTLDSRFSIWDYKTFATCAPCMKVYTTKGAVGSNRKVDVIPISPKPDSAEGESEINAQISDELESTAELSATATGPSVKDENTPMTDFMKKKTDLECGHYLNKKYYINVMPSHDASMLVSGSEDGGVWLWDVQTMTPIQVLRGHEDAVISVACHPKLDLIASAGHNLDKSVRIWFKPAKAAERLSQDSNCNES